MIAPSSILFFFFFFKESGAPRDLHSSPPRRSSDLYRPARSCSRPPRSPEPAAHAAAPSRDSQHSADRTQRSWALKPRDRKSTRLNSSHGYISYAVFCLKKKKMNEDSTPAFSNLL